MNFIRFAISLLASAIAILVGGFLTYLGAISLATTLGIYMFLNQESPDTGMTVNESLSRDGSAMIDFTASLTPWLIMFGELGIGLLLLFFGIRGLVRRLAKGPPAADEGDPRTDAGRAIQALFYGAGALFCLSLLLRSVFGMSDVLQVYYLGQDTNAVVENAWTTKGKFKYINHLSYSFTAEDGNVVTTEFEVPAKYFREHPYGAEIPVTYMANDPTSNLLPELVFLKEFTVFLAIYALLVVAGIRGFVRNAKALRG